MAGNLTRSQTRLRAFALTFPEATEDFPWGERVVKVGGKIFVFLSLVEDILRVAIKLPISAEMALTLPYVTPTGHGLGRHNWITARFVKGDEVPMELLESWIDQSYRAVAPKKLLNELDRAPTKVRR